MIIVSIRGTLRSQIFKMFLLELFVFNTFGKVPPLRRFREFKRLCKDLVFVSLMHISQLSFWRTMKTPVLVIYSSRLKIKDLLLMPQKIDFLGDASVSSELSESVTAALYLK